IHREGRWRLDQDLRPRHGHDMAAADAVDVGGEQYHAVRVVPDQISPDLVRGNDPGVLTRRAGRLVCGDGEKGQVLGIDARHIVLRDAFTVPAHVSYPASRGSKAPPRQASSLPTVPRPDALGFSYTPTAAATPAARFPSCRRS